MAVQPMKAIAAVALTQHLTVQQILAAGVIVSAVILLLGLTGLIDTVNRLIPRCVVRGIQLSVGLSLLIKGFQMVTGTGQWLGLDSFAIAAIAMLAVLSMRQSSRMPAALILFLAGLALAIAKSPALAGTVRLGLTFPHWTPLGWGDFVTAFPKAALPQIPLTTLNSVVAVCALSADLFPDHPASPRKVAVSVGLMNLVAGWFGGMPMCHGSGGLAGQYRFGARTNGSILFLGAGKMLLAILFGASLIAMCRAFPASVLGVMLGFSGLELALVCRDQTERRDAFIMLITAGACLGLNDVGKGFVLGLIVAWLGLAGPFRSDDRATERPDAGPRP
jgi:MFS superfamily sulfate permease-like transporter